jgi:hypothetical protein
MLELIKLNLGPFIGFLFTTATLLFIVWGAHRTERPGALEALQAEAAGEQPTVISPDVVAPAVADAAVSVSPDAASGAAPQQDVVVSEPADGEAAAQSPGQKADAAAPTEG